MNLSKIKEFYQKNKKTIFYCLLFVISFFYMWNSAFAEWNTADELSELTKTIVEFSNYLIAVASTLVALLSSFIALFLEPWAINGTIFWLDIYLKDIWILISNIVYFIFAFILIAIAFMNIIWKWEQKWELKTALPKFVIWVIIVPFTWFFVQFVLSISAFLTVSVLSLPYDTLNWTAAFWEKASDTKICTTYTISLFDKKPWENASDEAKEKYKKEKEKKELKNQIDNCPEWKLRSIKDILSGNTWWNTEDLSGAIYWMINIYTYWVMHVDQSTQIKKSTTDEIKTLADLGVKLILDLVFLVVFLIIMVALFLALFSRVMWLWIHAMFSPLYWLFYFLWEESWWEQMKKFSIKEFISLAMVPVYVSAALSFWIIFLFVAAHWLSQAPEEWMEAVLSKEWEDPAIKTGGFTLIIKWIKWNDVENDPNSPGRLFNDLFKWSWNAIWQLFLEIFWLAILWIAVMAALNQSTITRQVTEPIQWFGTSVWKLIAKSPQYTPIIPTPGGWLSPKWMANIASSAENYYTNTLPSDRSSKFMDKYKLFWNQWNINKLKSELTTAISSWTAKSIAEAWRKLLKSWWEINNAIRNKDVVWWILDIAQSSTVNIEKYKDTKIEDILWDKEKYYELIREIDKKMEGSLSADFIKWMKNWVTSKLQNDNQYNTLIAKTWDTKKKESPTADGADTASIQAAKAKKMKDLGITSNSNWNITKIWSITINNWEIDKSKYEDVAKELIEKEDIKTSTKEYFIKNFKEFWLGKESRDWVWEKIEELKSKKSWNDNN